MPLLALVFRDWGPELKAATARYDAWLAANPALPAGHLVSLTGERKVHPALGEIAYELRGRPMTRQCMPQTLWHFDKAAGVVRSLDGSARSRMDALVSRAGGADVMTLRLSRPMKRENHVLVLG